MKRKTYSMSVLTVLVVAFLAVPELRAQRGRSSGVSGRSVGRGSVHHSSSGSRSSSRSWSSSGSSSRSWSTGSSGVSVRGWETKTGNSSRSGTRTGTQPSTRTSRSSGGYRTTTRHNGGKKRNDGKYRGSHYEGYYNNKNYKHWGDARRDWYRYRSVNRSTIAGTHVTTCPRYYSTVVVSDKRYFYSGGSFYLSSGNRYVVVNPPVGAVVYGVPAPTTVVYSGDDPYYYVDGTYYVASNQDASLPAENPNYQQASGDSDDDDPQMIESEGHNYEVVPAPIGATVPYLPEGAKKEKIDGKTYYVAGDTYYRAYASDGDTVYMVVEKPGK